MDEQNIQDQQKQEELKKQQNVQSEQENVVLPGETSASFNSSISMQNEQKEASQHEQQVEDQVAQQNAEHKDTQKVAAEIIEELHESMSEFEASQNANVQQQEEQKEVLQPEQKVEEQQVVQTTTVVDDFGNEIIVPFNPPVDDFGNTHVQQQVEDQNEDGTVMLKPGDSSVFSNSDQEVSQTDAQHRGKFSPDVTSVMNSNVENVEETSEPDKTVINDQQKATNKIVPPGQIKGEDELPAGEELEEKEEAEETDEKELKKQNTVVPDDKKVEQEKKPDENKEPFGFKSDENEDLLGFMDQYAAESDAIDQQNADVSVYAMNYASLYSKYPVVRKYADLRSKADSDESKAKIDNQFKKVFGKLEINAHINVNDVIDFVSGKRNDDIFDYNLKSPLYDFDTYNVDDLRFKRVKTGKNDYQWYVSTKNEGVIGVVNVDESCKTRRAIKKLFGDKDSRAELLNKNVGIDDFIFNKYANKHEFEKYPDITNAIPEIYTNYMNEGRPRLGMIKDKFDQLLDSEKQNLHKWYRKDGENTFDKKTTKSIKNIQKLLKKFDDINSNGVLSVQNTMKNDELFQKIRDEFENLSKCDKNTDLVDFAKATVADFETCHKMSDICQNISAISIKNGSLSAEEMNAAKENFNNLLKEHKAYEEMRLADEEQLDEPKLIEIIGALRKDINDLHNEVKDLREQVNNSKNNSMTDEATDAQPVVDQQNDNNLNNLQNENAELRNQLDQIVNVNARLQNQLALVNDVMANIVEGRMDFNELREQVQPNNRERVNPQDNHQNGNDNQHENSSQRSL